jgi:hypothetical protein
MIVERMDQLSPRERVPMLFLVDAIVQVRRRRSSPISSAFQSPSAQQLS